MLEVTQTSPVELVLPPDSTILGTLTPSPPLLFCNLYLPFSGKEKPVNTLVLLFPHLLSQNEAPPHLSLFHSGLMQTPGSGLCTAFCCPRLSFLLTGGEGTPVSRMLTPLAIQSSLVTLPLPVSSLFYRSFKLSFLNFSISYMNCSSPLKADYDLFPSTLLEHSETLQSQAWLLSQSVLNAGRSKLCKDS